jgi:hypothetical protein
MYYKASKRDFYRWLHSTSLIGAQRVARKDWITGFHQAITGWMYKLGYRMTESWKQSPLALARWLYCVQVVEIGRRDYMGVINYEEPNHRDTQEDRDRYEFIVDHMAVEDFIDKFKQNEELDVYGKAGSRTQIELAEFLYRHIDIENSKQGHYVSRLLEPSSDSEEDDTGLRNTDSYLADSAEGWH